MSQRTSHIISGEALDATRPHLVRWGNVFLLILSFLGTIVAFHRSDWLVLTDTERLLSGPTIAALGLQLYCTVFEWMNRNNKRSLWYKQAYVLDVLPTIASFLPIAALMISGFVSITLWWVAIPTFPKDMWLIGGEPMTVVLALPLAGVTSHFVAVLPETRLIRS